VVLGGDPKGVNFLYTTGTSIVIRNIENPLIADLYNEHAHSPTVAKYAPSGFYIASGDTSGTLRIWDTTQAEKICKIELRPLGGAIADIAWSDDSKRLAIVGDGKEKFGAAILWDTGSSVGEIIGHSKAISTVDFKQTRPYRLITGGEDNLVGWFEGPPFKYKKGNTDHTRFVNCARFSPDGNLAISVSSDKTGIFFDGKTGDKIRTLSTDGGHTGGIYSVSWSPDGKRILTASGDKTSKIWDVETSKVISTHQFGTEVEDQQLGSLWQRDYLLTVNLSGNINYVDVNSPNKPIRILKGHNKFITALAFDKANKKVYSGAYDASIVSWDIETGESHDVAGRGHTNQINEIQVGGGNIFSAALDDSVRFTPTSTLAYSPDRAAVDGPAHSISVTENGETAITVTNNSIVIFKNKAAVATIPAPFGPRAVSISSNGTDVAVGGNDKNVYLYTLSGNSLNQTAKLEGHRGPLSAIAFSPNGKLLASGDTNREIILWDVQAKAIKYQGWVFHSARINSLAWSPDNVHLASGSLDQNIFIWNADAPASRIQIKNSHHLGVNVVIWLDENTVASGGQDCTWKTHTVKF